MDSLILSKMYERRMWAKRSVKKCPSCLTEQIQLISWVSDTLKFKCRHCKLKFEAEIVND